MKTQTASTLSSAPQPRTPMLGPDSPVTALRGVGPAMAELLAKLGLHTILEVLYYLPERHEDRSQLTPLRSLKPDMVTTAIGVVKEVRPAWNRFAPISVTLTDSAGGLLDAVWFRQPHLSKVFQRGQRLIVHGTIQRFKSGPLQMLVKDYEVLEGDGDPLHAGRLTPIYGLTAGVTQRPFRAFMEKLVGRFSPLVEDPLPAALRAKRGLLPLPAAVRAAHFPADEADHAAGRKRLVFDEFLLLQLGLVLRRNRQSREPGIAMDPPGDLARRLLGLLPYVLTGAQERVWREVRAGMADPQPQQRLIQGDVGAGKTLIAALAMVTAAEAGFQACLMAPNETLAAQHRLTLMGLLAPLDIEVALLTGSVAGGERARILTGLARRRSECPPERLRADDTGQAQGRPFSVGVDADYSPRCKPCHSKLDQGLRRAVARTASAVVVPARKPLQKIAHLVAQGDIGRALQVARPW